MLVLLCMLTSCKHEHEWSEWEVVSDATCTKVGTATRSCKCGETETREIQMHGHALSGATCTEPQTCLNNCGYTEGKPLGHSFGDWIVTTAATCTATGSEERACSCGYKETRDINATGHKYGEVVVTKSPSCTQDGEGTKTCTVCNDTATVVVKATGHKIATKVIKAATCATAGESQTYCSTCEMVIANQAIPATGKHTYDQGVETLASTCTEKGKKTFTCTVCQATKTSETAALGHKMSDNKCTRCGLVSLNLTQSEINKSKQVKSMSHSFGEYSSEIQINITLKDENGYSLQIPVYVYVKIVDEKNEILYEGTLIKSASQSKVTIPNKDIKSGYSNIGTLYYKVYNSYVSFDTISKELDDLDWTVEVELPDLPKTITYSGYSYSSMCKVTQITYKVSGDDITFYFEGEKTYDSNGNNYNSSCKIGWKLYDEDNYVLDDGTLYTNSLATGEKFKNESVNIYNCIEPGKSYKLVIMNVS